MVTVRVDSYYTLYNGNSYPDHNANTNVTAFLWRYAPVSDPPNRTVRNIRYRKFVLPGKVDQSAPKSLKTCLYAPIPLTLPNLSRCDKNVLDIGCSNFLLSGKVGQSPPNSGTKCRLARPLVVPYFVTLRQEMCEISAVKNLCSRKMDQSSLKSLMTWCAPMPLTLLNFL